MRYRNIRPPALRILLGCLFLLGGILAVFLVESENASPGPMIAILFGVILILGPPGDA